MNRRDFTTGVAVTTLALGGANDSQAQTPTPTDDDYDPIDMAEVASIELKALAATGITRMTENGLVTEPAPWARPAPRPRVTPRPGAGGIPRSTVNTAPVLNLPTPPNTYWLPTTTPRPQPVWPSDDRASDYRHLSNRKINGRDIAGFVRSADPGFELNGASLRFLAERNAFPLAALKRPLVVFGLRGCVAETPSVDLPQWGPVHRMRLATPDHIHFRCTIGVWRTDTDQIAIWRASTVPEVSLVHAFIQNKGFGCSLLPTGYYRYRSGTHGSRFPQPGALRIDQPYVVLRTSNDLSYDPFQAEDSWTQGGDHNLHAGSVKPPARFSSQGCQVIPGGYERPLRQVAKKEWKGFRDACGLTLEDGLAVPDENGGKGTYQYMLLTGLEGALFDHHQPDFINGYRRLRHGSSDPKVKTLQEQLYQAHNILADTDEEFGMKTSFAVLYEKKKAEGEHTSPIWEL